MPLHQPFEQIRNVHILGQSGSSDELVGWIKHTGVDLVAVNLDATDSLKIVERVTVTCPNCGVIGISTRTDPTSIIGAMRVGCGQFVPWPVDVADLQAAVDRIGGARVAEPRPSDSTTSGPCSTSKRICVIGSSGGAGATTVACNLAVELAHLTKHACLLVDMDLELGDIGCVFDAQPMFSLADLCRDGVEVDSTMLHKALHELPNNVSLLVRPDRLEEAREITPEGVANILAVAGQVFPYVVVDLPRSFSFFSAAALGEADCVLIVSQLSVSSIRNATRIYKCLCQMGAPERIIEIVLNRCKADFAQITPDHVESHMRKPVFGTIPNDYKRVQSSLDLGHGIMVNSPNSPARLAIQKIARKIAGDHLPDEEDVAPRRGILGRLRGRKPSGSDMPVRNETA